jgi:hypothetical protein
MVFTDISNYTYSTSYFNDRFGPANLANYAHFKDIQNLAYSVNGDNSVMTHIGNVQNTILNSVDSLEIQVVADLSAEASTRLAIDQGLQQFIQDSQNAVMESLSIRVSTEASARVAGDTSLESSLNNTISDLDFAFDRITTEASTRLSADDSIVANLSTELVARASGDASIASGLSSELVARASAMTAEIEARLAGDASLQAEIDFITSNVDPVAIDSLTEIVAAFQSADGTINGAISNLSSAATSGLSAEASIRLAADNSLATSVYEQVSLETVLREQQDADLLLYVIEYDNLYNNRALSAETSLEGRIDSEFNGRTEAISTETSLRVVGDVSLESALSQEISIRTSAASIEESARISGDNSLANSLSTNLDELYSIAVSADVSLAVNLSTELVVRASADASLAADLSTEASNRISISAVHLARAISAEDSIVADLSAETSARIAADASLATSLSTEVAYLISNVDITAMDSFSEVSAEIASLTNGFNNVYTKIVAVSGTIDGVNTVFTLASPLRIDSETFYLNGLLQDLTSDYTISVDGNGDVTGFTFVNAPLAGDKVKAYGVY